MKQNDHIQLKIADTSLKQKDKLSRRQVEEAGSDRSITAKTANVFKDGMIA